MSLKVNNIVKKYNDKVVVDNLNFEMNSPGVYALLGTNGAGKTTSLRIILNMLAYDEGSVTWNDKPLNISTVNLGYLPEERGLYPKFSILDQLLYFATLKNVPKKTALERIRTWSKKFQVDEYIFPSSIGKSNKKKEYKADQLSKGNQQKIQLITALISEPELLILDEPLSGLDPVNTDLFKGIIHEIAKSDKYLIMSSHQMPVIEEFCSDITILNKGKTVLQGDLNTIKKGYGRVNLFVKCEDDIEKYIKENVIAVVEKTPSEYHLKVNDENHAMTFLKKLIDNNVAVIKFELREPSLHEIFIEKVGKNNE